MVRPAQAPRSPAQRSAVTNGSRILVGVDGNSPMARRYRDLVEGLRSELNDRLAGADLLIVRNAATLQLHAEDLTARMVRGETVDPEAITRAANGATRALEALRRRKAIRRPTRRTAADLVAQRGSGA